MTIQPNGLFEVWRADEVAECLDGVFSAPNGLYEALWEIADKQQPIPNKEDTGPADHIGHEALADHWADLTEDQQAKLNELAEAFDRKLQQYRLIDSIDTLRGRKEVTR